jgi:hypothetical protein
VVLLAGFYINAARFLKERMMFCNYAGGLLVRMISPLMLMSFVSGTAVAQWNSNPSLNNAVCTAPLSQDRPSVVTDGAGGAIIV